MDDRSGVVLKRSAPAPIDHSIAMRNLKATLLDILRSAPHAEAGFAVPTVMFMLLAVTAVVAVGVVASVNTQRGTVRDQDTKTALTAAETGVSQAFLHYNRIVAPQSSPCLVASTSGGTVGAQGTDPSNPGWCRPVASTEGDFTYYVRPGDGTLEVVSVGRVDGVTRRVYVQGIASSGQRMFSKATVLSQNGITLASNSLIGAGTATNGDITMSGNAQLCGGSSVGLDRHLTTNQNSHWYQHYASGRTCTGVLDPNTVAHAPLTLPPINQGDVPTNNDNGRLFSQDPITGSGNKVSWDPASRELSIGSNNYVTLGGSTYSFCKVTMSSNTAIYIASGATVNIYFDSPEACGLPSGTTQLDMNSNARISASSGDPKNVAIYFVGSPTLATKANLSSNTQVNGACDQNFVIYAPLTDLKMNSNTSFCGAVAAKTISMDANVAIYSDSAAQSFMIPWTSPHYVVSRFVECRAAHTTPPDANC